VVSGSDEKLTINLETAGRDFFSVFPEATIPEAIKIETQGFHKTVLIHRLSEAKTARQWDLECSLPLTRFLTECRCDSGANLVLQKIAPAEFRLYPAWKPFTFIDLFAGIGGIRLGVEAVGGRCVFSSEWDTKAQITYAANFGEMPAGDITKVAESSIPNHDILLAGFPCQPFSIIGNRQGFQDTRGTLFFEIERILRYHQPTAILLENVKQFRTHDGGKTCKTVLDILTALGYKTHVKVLNALDYGVAQKRERIFIVGFREEVFFEFPEPFSYRPHLSAILQAEDEVDPTLVASPMIQRKRLERIRAQGKEPFYPSIWHENKGGHIGMHPFSCALRHNASYNYLLVDGRRRPTGREMLRLQGYPESFKIVVDHPAIRSQAGNSVAVPIITAIAAQMGLSLRLARSAIKPIRQKSLFEVGEIA
jgi:DNA (cytosine-5)-methyltransferase 1